MTVKKERKQVEEFTLIGYDFIKKDNDRDRGECFVGKECSILYFGLQSKSV